MSAHNEAGTAENLPKKGSDGLLPSFAWPGEYPIIYIDRECEVVCAKCATTIVDDSETDVEIVAADIYWEGPTMFCAECNCAIESAYGDPKQEETNNG